MTVAMNRGFSPSGLKSGSMTVALYQMLNRAPEQLRHYRCKGGDEQAAPAAAARRNVYGIVHGWK